MANRARIESSASHPPESSIVPLLAGWIQQGIASFFATQRILVDLAMQQNASVMKILRERFADRHNSPVTIVNEMAAEGMANFIEAQKVLLDLAQQQNEILLTGVRERVSDRGPSAGAMTDLLRRSLDSFIAMQQEFLKIATKPTHACLEATRTGKPYQGECLAKLAREGMERFVHARKQFLDVVAEETANATGGKGMNGSARATKRTELLDLANQVTESFLDAEKKLFDLVNRQANVNLKAAGRASGLMTPLPFLGLADLTRQGVRSYVDAQKALMDAVLKPSNGHRHEAQPERRGRRSARFGKPEIILPLRVV